MTSLKIATMDSECSDNPTCYIAQISHPQADCCVKVVTGKTARRDLVVFRTKVINFDGGDRPRKRRLVRSISFNTLVSHEWPTICRLSCG